MKKYIFGYIYVIWGYTHIFHSRIPNAVDFTLLFNTSFVPIEALLDVWTSTFTEKIVLFKILIYLFSHIIWACFFWFNVLTINIKMCRRFKMSKKLFLRVKIVMSLSPVFGGSHFLVF